MNASAQMPIYRCHKEVHALKISQIRANIEDNSTEIRFASPGFEPIILTPDESIRFRPFGYGSPDYDKGYLVIYADGYRSWSPTKAFEEGYTLVG